MDAEDSASDRPHSKRHSRRESPSSNLEERGHMTDTERSSSKRKSKRSRERSLEERRRHTPSRRIKSQSDDQDTRSAYGSASAPKKSERSRHQKRKSRSRDVRSDEFVETPVTRVLRDVPDDILDTPLTNLYGTHLSTSLGDADNENYRVQKGRDCVYVEHYDGFSSVPRHSALADGGGDSGKKWFDLSTATALDVAIAVQRTWIPLTDFCHGLLAGIALMQVILVDRLFGSSPEETLLFISFYSNFSLIFTTTFFLLASVCLVSIFDRLDLARGDWPYLVDLLSVRPRIPWMLIPIYIGGLILALAAAKGDRAGTYH